ncbi:MAG: hypothetical protein SOU08_03265 [Anaerococcus sp.]|nr:hypothetical protein [Anaerococcus sp.]MDD7043969.1 hypothetical protein [Peptoniphilaceae bacterium]MDY2918641.1 hypothetical protein [Anaerococcus sp.]
MINNNISIFNQEIVTSPKSIVAKFKGLKEMDLLQEENIENKDQ